MHPFDGYWSKICTKPNPEADLVLIVHDSQALMDAPASYRTRRREPQVCSFVAVMCSLIKRTIKQGK
jgi:hypothetical protein